MDEQRIHTPRNVAWSPRPGWATVRLVGTCADRSLRRGRVVMHLPSDDYHSIPGHDHGLEPERIVIVLAEATHLIEDDLHLVPEGAVVAVGEPLP